MHADSSPGDQLRSLRLDRGLTREALAERAGLGTGVIKKIENGGSARVETYHALARALGVRTSKLFDSGPPGPSTEDDRDLALLALRQAISPAVTAAGPLGPADTVEPAPDLAAVRRTSETVASAYYRDDYAAVTELLPPLVRSVRLAVRHFDHGPLHSDALRLRGRVLQMAGRYLVQVRAYDLAHLALRDAVLDAVAAEDQAGLAAAVYQQGWLLIRQGRLDEAEQVSVVTADACEPRISRATPADLGAWGKLWRPRPPSCALRPSAGHARAAGPPMPGASAPD